MEPAGSAVPVDEVQHGKGLARAKYKAEGLEEPDNQIPKQSGGLNPPQEYKAGPGMGPGTDEGSLHDAEAPGSQGAQG